MAPSQGTHFFQNLTSFNVGYIHVDPFSRSDDIFDIAQLDALPAVYETNYVRLIRTKSPLTAIVDGKNNKALIHL